MGILAEGTSVLVVGLAVVFLILIILMIVTSLFKFIFKPAEKDEKQEPVQAAAPAEAPKAQAEFKPGFDTEDGELVAVIASSIAAALNTGSGDIKIRSIRKVN